MGDRFSDLQMLKLVEIYRDHECLWNITSSLYKNHDARQSAYRQIAEKLNISGISAKEIPKKIKNLRSSYYQELKKIKKSPRSGGNLDSVYKPKVSWFTTADGFLGLLRKKKQTFSNIEENSNTTDTDDSETKNTVSEGNSNYPESLKLPDEIINGGDNTVTYCVEEQNETSLSGFTVPSKRTIQKRGKPNKNDDISEAIEKIGKIAKSITKNTKSLLQNKNDEFDDFGKYIASTLRSLPGEFSITARTDIQKTLSEIQLKALKQKTKSQSSFNASRLNTHDPDNSEYFSSAPTVCDLINYDDKVQIKKEIELEISQT